MAARGSNPVRRARPGARSVPRAVVSDQQPTGAGTPAGVPALPGLAVAPASGQAGQLRAGLRARSARPKLLVGSADDPAEAAADAMAEAVVHRLLAPAVPGHPDADAAGLAGDTPSPTDAPATGVLAALRRTPTTPTPAAPTGLAGPAPATGAAIGLSGGEVDGATEQALAAARSAGTALAPALRRQYEDAFGADFSSVRVHAGPASARLNSALGARAFTLGSDIYFGDRVPGGATAEDRHLMAHELAHTLQDGTTAHRQVLRRLAVQITPFWEAVQAEDADMVEEAVLPSAETQPHLDVQPPLEVQPRIDAEPSVEAHPVNSDETMMLEQPATDGRATQAWELVIKSVAIVGRPPTLFSGSMGDHTTAFVISRKGVENAVTGQLFTDAVRELDEMAADLKTLPGWKLVDALLPAEDGEALETGTEPTTMADDATGSAIPSSAPVLAEDPELDDEGAPVQKVAYRRASHHSRFTEAEQALTRCRQLLGEADTDDLKVLRLQGYIAAYLELRELIPLSASNWKGANRGKGGKGDGETGLEGFLADADTQQPGNLRRDFLSTIATYRLAQAAIEPNEDALAILMPGLDYTLSDDERTELMARQHVQSVLSNFPQNFAGLAEDILLAEGREHERLGRGGAANAAAERDQDANFAIVLNHLTRIIRLRYPEAAQQEYAHHMQVARLARQDDDLEHARIAERDAAALTKYLSTPEPDRTKASTLTEEERKDGRVDKRVHASSPKAEEGSDELYQGLTPTQAKKVYTGRDGFRKTSALTSPLPKSDLAVQLLLDDTGAILRPIVGRQGKYVKGAHTIPWTQWVRWLGADIAGKQPAAALAAFLTTTAPTIRAKLAQSAVATPTPQVMPIDAMPTPALPTGAMPTLAPETTALGIAAPEQDESEQEEIEQPSGSTPLIELQVAIADLLEEITDAADSSVLDATDTGGKAEAYHRSELLAYEDGKREISPEGLVAHILALCDVGQAKRALAVRTVQLALDGAAHDYPKAYAASLIETYEIEDLVDRASIGKEGVYEYESEQESSSEEEEPPKKKKKTHKGK